MAHFAELDSNNIVRRVIVIANEELLDENGAEQESIGRVFCEDHYPNSGRWVQTSYRTHAEGNPRKNFAGKGCQYDEVRDAFIPPKRHPAWVLDEQSCSWVPPWPRPDQDHIYEWSDENEDWVAV